ncbi:MAG: NADH-quinone oxidoreductase subunit C [Desulfovibrio sp.]|jgi:ech hydrogenase subunit D|nr:NADH-quinone oxidoreductase subunit C [Desulfovibrio sp.]
MSIEATPVTPAQLVAEVTKLKAEGYRLVTFSSVEIDAENMEILYHFDKDLKLKNLRLSVKKGGSVPSISGVLFTAFLIENEIRDQFSITFEGLVLDYQGKLLNDCLTTPQTSPFCRMQVASSGAAAKEVR